MKSNKDTRYKQVKLHGTKKRLWFGSINGPITCKLEMDSIFFFFHNSEISAVRHVYVTQSSLKRPIHVTRDMAVAQEVSLPK